MRPFLIGGGNRIRKAVNPEQNELNSLSLDINRIVRQGRPRIAEPGGKGLHDLPKSAKPGSGDSYIQATARDHRWRGKGPGGSGRLCIHRTDDQHLQRDQSCRGDHQQCRHFPDHGRPFYPCSGLETF